jgi:hypothetical protein
MARSRPGRKRRSGRPRRANNNVDSLNARILQVLRISAPSVPPPRRDVELPPPPRRQVYTIRRAYDAGLVSTSNGISSTGQITTSLSVFPDFTDFTSLFDAYRITHIRVTFTPIQQNTLSTAARIFTVIDYDDANVLPSPGAAEEYDTCQVSTIDNTSCVTRVYRPKYALAAFSGVFTSFAQSSGQWLDVASATVAHYGLKWITDPDTSIKNVYRIDVLGVLQFVNVR